MRLPWRYDLGQLIESTEELVESFHEFLSRKDQRQRREADDVCKQDAVKKEEGEIRNSERHSQILG